MDKKTVDSDTKYHNFRGNCTLEWRWSQNHPQFREYTYEGLLRTLLMFSRGPFYVYQMSDVMSDRHDSTVASISLHKFSRYHLSDCFNICQYPLTCAQHGLANDNKSTKRQRNASVNFGVISDGIQSINILKRIFISELFFYYFFLPYP